MGVLYQVLDERSVPSDTRTAAALSLDRAKRMLNLGEVQVDWVAPARARKPGVREVASLDLDVESAADGLFKGIASAFDTLIDAAVPTIIKPGAFAKTLADPEHNVIILWQHSDAIGRPIELKETARRLEIVGMISNTQAGRDALTLMREGIITEMSIGFDAVEAHFEDRDGELIRIVTEAVLWEVSLVNFGANPGAKISEVNQFDLLPSTDGWVSFGPRSLGETHRAPDGRVQVLLRADLSPEQAANTAAHEVRHVAQFRESWLMDGQVSYHRQTLEKQARAFGDEAARSLRDLTNTMKHEPVRRSLEAAQAKQAAARAKLRTMSVRESYDLANFARRVPGGGRRVTRGNW